VTYHSVGFDISSPYTIPYRPHSPSQPPSNSNNGTQHTISHQSRPASLDIMAAKTTINVPHLGGISAGYRSTGIDAAKPTLVLINSMCTTSALYDEQFNSKTLTDAVNLLAIEPLGHGATTSATEHFTYWDTATMALQVMEALNVQKAFVLGTSQGGWMVVRMALLAPEKVGLLSRIIFPISVFPSRWAKLITTLADPRRASFGHIHGLRVCQRPRVGRLEPQGRPRAIPGEVVCPQPRVCR